MTDEELLSKVKAGLGIGPAFHDPNLSIKTKAVKQYMLHAGVSEAQLYSELGIATLTVGVNDLWNITSGEVKFSEAFLIILMPQLMTVSLGDGS
jgi:hypothetical protein